MFLIKGEQGKKAEAAWSWGARYLVLMQGGVPEVSKGTGLFVTQRPPPFPATSPGVGAGTARGPSAPAAKDSQMPEGGGAGQDGPSPALRLL